MSTEKNIRELPSTDEARMMASSKRGVDELAGTILLDRYRLIELRGEGGAAVVYRAEHSIMHKPVAVKVLRHEHSARQDYIQRFIGEARSVAKLRHDHIVGILDIDRTEDGYVFCVMEYLEGEELGDTLDREGPMPLGRARDIVIQVAEALAAAHAVGIVHRDVKPQNIFRTTHGGNRDFVKLLDFGIAKQVADQAGITNTGMVMGTAEYMAPEQCKAQPVDARADIYSLGVTLFELLSGRCPFEGDGFLDILMKHVSDRAPRLSVLVPSLPPAVDPLMERALAKRPDDRFASMEEFVEALEAIDTGTQRVEAVKTDPTPPAVSQAQHYVPGPHSSVEKSSTAQIVVAVLAGAILCAVATLGLYLLTREDTPPATSNLEAASPTPAEASAARSPEGLEPRVVPLETAKRNESDDAVPEIENSQVAAPDPVDPPQPAPEPDPNPKPDATARPATGPTTAEKNKLKRSIQNACAGAVGFQERTVTVHVRGSRAAAVRIDPPYPLLGKCVEEQLVRMPEDTYRLRLQMKPGDR
jgi:eukaryotic-like serine/threonine-protein kinase